jgi:alpha-L-arabinofuranosidase
VNAGKESKSIKIDQSGFSKIVSDAEQTVLTGDAHAENTFENPQKVDPIKSTFSVRKTFEYETPAMSLTVIRMKTRI